MKLGKYKGLRIAKPDTTVTDREVAEYLEKKQREYRVVRNIDHRAAEEGDEVVLDFDITCDGQPMKSGRTRNYALLLGSHRFVAGFEEAVIGHSIGDIFDVTIRFPENYRMAHLQGKNVCYHVTLKQIRVPEYQPVDDDFAMDFSEYPTLEEWKVNILATLQERRNASAYEKLARDLMTQIIENSKIHIDQELKREVFEELYEDFLYELEENGMTFEQYCRRSGKNKKMIRAEKENEAIRTIQEQSVLHAIANREKITVTEEELSSELCAIAAEEGEEIDDFIDMLGEEEMESIADQLQLTKAMSFILENAILE